ncbi:MAG: deoxyribonuclease IV [Patescibacteria group bacterium]
MNKIGAHVSAAGKLSNAPFNAYKEGCECFQFFSRPPQGGSAIKLHPEDVELFKKRCSQYKLESYIHAPYYINFASLNSRIKQSSISVVREELERGSQLGVKYLMTHLGTAAGYKKRDQAINEVIKSLNACLKGYEGKTIFLIENTAGSGELIGGDFKELKTILQGLQKHHVGICLDVMHAFGYGYTPQELFNVFAKQIGMKYLKLIHANDSMVELGSKKDRHEHIGQGKIGIHGFALWLTDKRIKKINFILETPIDKRVKDLKILKKLRCINK